MKLLSLHTEGYRNLQGQTLELCDGINLLYGDNAAGKTNTLECAYVFASGKSFRARHESELIKNCHNTATASITFEKGGLTHGMSVVWHKSKERGYVKRMLYEGYEVSKASEFLGNFRAVLFTPDDLSLIKGSPEERRRFLDIALSQLQPKYVKHMNNYLTVLGNKNAYLKKAMLTGKCDADYMDVLNRQLAGSAAIIIKQRSGFAEMLREISTGLYSILSGSKETLDVRYHTVTKSGFTDAKYTEDKLFEIFTADRESELRYGKTVHGPHKDDLMVYLSTGASGVPEQSGLDIDYDADSCMREFAARTFGSQGQQRSAVLAIKLAEAEIFKQITGEYPVLLLDDLLGELDIERRRLLMSLISGKQTIISCCDRQSFPPDISVNAIRVENGSYKI